jgi:hypothetical protein
MSEWDEGQNARLKRTSIIAYVNTTHSLSWRICPYRNTKSSVGAITFSKMTLSGGTMTAETYINNNTISLKVIFNVILMTVILVNVIKLNVIELNVSLLSVILLNAIQLCVIQLNVILLSVRHGRDWKKARSRIRKYRIGFWKLEINIKKILYRNLITYTCWAGTKLKVSKTYNTIFWDTKYQWCYFKKISKYIVFFALVISFKLFQTHCTILCSWLPIEMTWNRVFLSETDEKLRLCFGKMIWNWVFLSETGGKLRLYFGKMIWNWVFLSETSEKSRLCLKLIISELCLFVDTKQLQFKKSGFMTVFIWIFQKKGSQNWI